MSKEMNLRAAVRLASAVNRFLEEARVTRAHCRTVLDGRTPRLDYYSDGEFRFGLSGSIKFVKDEIMYHARNAVHFYAAA